MRSDPERWLQPVRTIAAAAAAQILAIYADEMSVDVDIKDDATPLTRADRVAHEAIVAGLCALTPDIPVISEESVALPFAQRQSWPRYWLIDPLDGTKEFIKHNGEFTVNIALIEQHQPVLGVVHVPVTGASYFAVRGRGAWRADADGVVQRIRVRSQCGAVVRVVSSRSHGTPEVDAFIHQLGDHAFLAVGSSLKFCRVAEGQADVYPRLGHTSEWDTAAAQCIVEAAGGHVMQLDGSPLVYNTRESFINPYFIAVGDGSRDWMSFVPVEV